MFPFLLVHSPHGVFFFSLFLYPFLSALPKYFSILRFKTEVQLLRFLLPIPNQLCDSTLLDLLYDLNT